MGLYRSTNSLIIHLQSEGIFNRDPGLAASHERTNQIGRKVYGLVFRNHALVAASSVRSLPFRSFPVRPPSSVAASLVAKSDRRRLAHTTPILAKCLETCLLFRHGLGKTDVSVCFSKNNKMRDDTT